MVSERRDDERLWSELLGSVEAIVHHRLRAGDELEEIYTWFTNDNLRMAARLEARGFVRSEGPDGHVLTADLAKLPEPVPVPPGGYELGCMAGNADVHWRVESHRAAFAPSDLTVPIDERVRRTWPYRPELDRIVRTSDGEIAACCIAWLDENNDAGLLEPVSTHRAHQNRGLARLVVGDALRILGKAGATVAQVGTSSPAARAAYTATGFRPWKREITFRKRVKA